ncbi:MAG: helix-turn-helix domain-containing protein [Megasphaera micronuciformis]|nr:helix-turn-helix domain-containing protein [Megasphaera micronuciformis]
MDFAKRLKELRMSRGLTQDDLARELRLVKSSISMYENGKRKPSFEVLEAIADYFNVNMDTLYSSAPVFVPSLKRVPMLGYAAAGQPLENLDGQDTYYVETDSRYAVDFCITVRGDSTINADINDGDIVYVRSQPEVSNGKIAGVEIDNERVCIKRFYKTDTGVMLVSENPKYAPLQFDDSNCDNLRILGLAVLKQSEII